MVEQTITIEDYFSDKLSLSDQSQPNQDVESQVAPQKKRTIDEFQLMSELGQGAFGTVYLGKDKLTDKIVAIKSVNQDRILQLDKSRHVFREKKLLSELQHPNIVKLITTLKVTVKMSLNQIG